MGKHDSHGGNGNSSHQPPSAEKSVLSQRSLIRGVIMRAEQISESFLDMIDPVSDENVMTKVNKHIWEHRLRLRNHIILGQTVGFWIETHDMDKPALRLFFDGMNMSFFLCENYQDGRGEALCSVEVFRQAKKGEYTAIAGSISEIDFWENDFEQTLSECIKYIVPYTTSRGGISTQNSVYSEREFVDGLDRFALTKDEESKLSIELDDETKNVKMSRMSKKEGFSYAEAPSGSIADTMKSWKQRNRIMPSIENNYNRFVYSVMGNLHKKRNEDARRDEDGNLTQKRESRVKFSHMNSPTAEDVSDLIKRQGNAIVTRTAAEVIKGAGREHKNKEEKYVQDKRLEKTKHELEKRKQNIAAMMKVRDSVKRKINENDVKNSEDSEDVNTDEADNNVNNDDDEKND